MRSVKAYVQDSILKSTLDTRDAYFMDASFKVMCTRPETIKISSNRLLKLPLVVPCDSYLENDKNA